VLSISKYWIEPKPHKSTSPLPVDVDFAVNSIKVKVAAGSQALILAGFRKAGLKFRVGLTSRVGSHAQEAGKAPNK
jgi:hypothetical protein